MTSYLKILAVLTIVAGAGLALLICRAPVSNRKVGGIRFLKVGRLTVSVCMAREGV